MTRLLWLPTVLRQWGLHVELVPGWEARGAPFDAVPRVPVAHHTATARSRTKDYPSLGIVRDGRPDLSGPLSQTGLGYSGTVYVIASGKANHAGPGAWRGVTRSALTIGTEAESPGDGTWTPQQLRAYPILMAALCDGLNTTADMVCGHREWALPHGRKVDPTGIDMNLMRTHVAHLLAAGPHSLPLPPTPAPAVRPKPVPTPQVSTEDDMRALYRAPGQQAVWISDGISKRWVGSQKQLRRLIDSKQVPEVVVEMDQDDLDAMPTVGRTPPS